MKRKIIEIDEERCNGCGVCVPSCAEGAIQIIDGKARLVKDQYCDGLGACLGECPQDALKITEREAEEFDEEAAKVFVAKTRPAVVHTPHHHVGGGCPGSRMISFERERSEATTNASMTPARSELTQWPIQLHLLPIQAPFFNEADLLLAADCVAFAFGGFHGDFLKGKALAIGCPKLDETDAYREKLTEIIRRNDLKGVTVAHMEVPCCSGMTQLAKMARDASGKDMAIRDVTVGIDGSVKAERTL